MQSQSFMNGLKSEIFSKHAIADTIINDLKKHDPNSTISVEPRAMKMVLNKE